jgi:hypothetical protein
MALISLNPLTEYDLCVRIARNEDKYVLVINNKRYHTLSDEKKAEVYNYYKDPIDADTANWIIPEAEIDAVFEAETLYYVFPNQIKATEACYDWFPHLPNLPDADHFIEAYVVAPNGTIPFGNGSPTQPA